MKFGREPSIFSQSVGEHRVAIGFTASWRLLGILEQEIAGFRGKNRF
jgi:hypothetical protein